MRIRLRIIATLFAISSIATAQIGQRDQQRTVQSTYEESGPPDHKGLPCSASALPQCGVKSPCFDCKFPSCFQVEDRKLLQAYEPCQFMVPPCSQSKMMRSTTNYKACTWPCPEYKIKPCDDFSIKPLAGTDPLYKDYGMQESAPIDNLLLAQNNTQNAGKQTAAQPHDPNPLKDPDVQRGYDEHQRQHGRESKSTESSYDVHTSSGSANSGSNGGGDDTPPSKGSSVPRYAPEERRPTVVRPAPGPIPHQ